MFLRTFPFLILLLLVAACQRSETTPLKVGMELQYPPFESTNQNGQPAGISIDLAMALGESLHRKVIIEDMPFDGLIPSLKTGKIDLVISSMTDTPEREQSIDFSDSYFHSRLALLLAKSSPAQSDEDLNSAGRHIVVKSGTTGQIFAQAHFDKAQVIPLDQEAECVLEVSEGKADAFIYDQLSILKGHLQNPDTTRVLLKPLTSEPWAIGIRKNNDALRNQVNAFLKEFRATGGFDRLGEKWLSADRKAFQHLGIPFDF